MAVVEVRCPDCDSMNVVKYGKQPNGKQRYICHHAPCPRRIFLRDYHSRARTSPSETRLRIIDLALRGADIDETAHLLQLPRETVMAVFQHLSRFKAAPPGPKKRRGRTPQALAG